jgi:excisionase family DNA binding protein
MARPEVTGQKIVESPEKLTITVPEAGRLLGIGQNSAYAAAAKGEIPTLRIGGRLLVPRAALERLLHEVGTCPKKTFA